VPAEVYERTTSAAREAGSSAHDAWNATFNTWASSNPDKRDLLQRLTSKQTPATFNDARPTFGAGVPVATRKAFGRALKAAAAELPVLWVALPTSANPTTPPSTMLRHSCRPRAIYPARTPPGRRIHWGIREHFMAAAMNGISLSGLSRPYGGTFLVFSDYMRPAVRLAALMKLQAGSNGFPR
jgi:transketolase